MPAQKSLHVVPSPNGGWSVKQYGAHRASRHFDSRSAAIRWGRDASRNNGAAFFIHRKDGTVQEKTSPAGEGHL
ncbi:MAG TPA: DUF2188 domain-containing protein [Longimicrobium sp.]